ncbi:MAG: hypothetical protein KAT28_02880 [Candidatus Aenigmarchaeota archaeon]|nr:hypothetical protein [Candidatus Aenigmarchaeota archaeon]
MTTYSELPYWVEDNKGGRYSDSYCIAHGGIQCIDYARRDEVPEKEITKAVMTHLIVSNKNYESFINAFGEVEDKETRDKDEEKYGLRKRVLEDLNAGKTIEYKGYTINPLPKEDDSLNAELN